MLLELDLKVTAKIFQRSHFNPCACCSMSSAPSLFTDKTYSVCILAAAGVVAATQRKEEGFSLSGTELISYSALAILPAAIAAANYVQQPYEHQLDPKLPLREEQKQEAARVAGMNVVQLLKHLGYKLEQLAEIPETSYAQRVKQTLYPWGNTSEQAMRRSITCLRENSVAHLNDKLTNAETGLIAKLKRQDDQLYKREARHEASSKKVHQLIVQNNDKVNVHGA
jgi:hypothetical protein